MKDAYKFFHRKKSWSKYKDLILDYYLKPYLSKVARLGKPIAVVDCFAGAGRFRDGQDGSPLIVHRHLCELHARGLAVRGVFIEKHPVLFKHLQQAVPAGPVPVTLLSGDFHSHIAFIAKLAETHSIFAYLDPIKPSQLAFDDLATVYAQLGKGHSVETLINFLSPSFLRGIRGVMSMVLEQEAFDVVSPMASKLDRIAGGNHWRQVLLDDTPDARKVEALADHYAERLSIWFKWRIKYAVRRKYSDAMPKYHLIFGSRHEDAIDLMNRAMVNARREFLGAEFVDGQLFDTTPQSESVDPAQIRATVLTCSHTVGRCNWKHLRVRATITNPCRYTDAEMNHAIKQAIVDGFLESTADGKRIEEDHPVWLTPKGEQFLSARV